MKTIFPVHSVEPRGSRETEYEFFSRMAREHAQTQRRERRERMLRKLIRRTPGDRRRA